MRAQHSRGVRTLDMIFNPSAVRTPPGKELVCAGGDAAANHDAYEMGTSFGTRMDVEVEPVAGDRDVLDRVGSEGVRQGTSPRASSRLRSVCQLRPAFRGGGQSPQRGQDADVIGAGGRPRHPMCARALTREGYVILSARISSITILTSAALSRPFPKNGISTANRPSDSLICDFFATLRHVRVGNNLLNSWLGSGFSEP
jgi:hypothetical protein